MPRPTSAKRCKRLINISGASQGSIGTYSVHLPGDASAKTRSKQPKRNSRKSHPEDCEAHEPKSRRRDARLALELKMASFAGKRDPDKCPTHPGSLLRDEILPALGKPKAEIAKSLGVSRQHLYQILCEDRPVTAGMAVRFGKMFGNEPMMWLRMQAAHDAWHAAREIDVSRIPTLWGA
jgi:addiction module HigA family antidote